MELVVHFDGKMSQPRKAFPVLSFTNQPRDERVHYFQSVQHHSHWLGFGETDGQLVGN